MWHFPIFHVNSFLAGLGYWEGYFWWGYNFSCLLNYMNYATICRHSLLSAEVALSSCWHCSSAFNYLEKHTISSCLCVNRLHSSCPERRLALSLQHSSACFSCLHVSFNHILLRFLNIHILFFNGSKIILSPALINSWDQMSTSYIMFFAQME